ncbi:MAG TPA: hypothetical protein VKE51_19765 [Vicinamibacterales bacterium]|nr:hypothetical protein [Vicinamibacterales bacterium]
MLRAGCEEYQSDGMRYFGGVMVYPRHDVARTSLLMSWPPIGSSLRFSSAAAGITAHVLTIVETNLGE